MGNGGRLSDDVNNKKGFPAFRRPPVLGSQETISDWCGMGITILYRTLYVPYRTVPYLKLHVERTGRRYRAT